MDVSRRHALDTSARAAGERERRWSSLRPLLRCPACRRPLTAYRAGESLGCGDHTYPIRHGVPLLLAGPLQAAALAWQPAAGGRLRDRVWQWIPGPTAAARQTRLLRQFLGEVPLDATIINIGAGGWNLGARVHNLDLFPFANVDIAGDVHDLPLADDSVGAIICTGALEHIESPELAVGELFRTLRPGGRVFCTVPFLQAYHEDPIDLQRWTAPGLDRLFAAFARRSIRPSHGPGSALAWIGAEYFATLLSFGNSRLHTVWLMLGRVLFAPFKWTDAITETWAIEHRVSAGLLIVAEKP